eukprot:1611483-Pyramimonas_sp.AAC.1
MVDGDPQNNPCADLQQDQRHSTRTTAGRPGHGQRREAGPEEGDALRSKRGCISVHRGACTAAVQRQRGHSSDHNATRPVLRTIATMATTQLCSGTWSYGTMG